MKKVFALAVGILLVGFAFAAAQEETQEQTKAQAQVKAQKKIQTKAEVKAQNKVQTKSAYQHRFGTVFIDENGDGINDAARDADGDGIPNGQDADWTRPLDGSGYKDSNRVGRPGTTVAELEAEQKAMLARDDDGDGIPNGQDADWTRPLDGSGYKDSNRVGRPDDTEMTQGQKAGQLTKANFGKGSFRQGTMAAGRTAGIGVCDGTGPKGAVQRKGRR